MIALDSKPVDHLVSTIFIITASAVVTLAVLIAGITCNQAFALALTLIVLTLWWYNRVNGLITGLIFFVTKAFFVRVAFAFDYVMSTTGRDLLSITPAIVLASLILFQLFEHYSSGERILSGRTRLLLGSFSIFCVLSVLNPANTVINGLAGLERNILPNMLIFLTASFIFRSQSDLQKLVKVMMLVGVASCLYAVGQYINGAYPWELPWLQQVEFKDSFRSLTVGLRGIELRVFSLFYGYMDFTFTNVLIFAMAISCGRSWSLGWRRVRVVYVVAWFIILLLTLERMPMLMSLVAAVVTYYYQGNALRRRVVIGSTAVVVSVLIIGLNLSGSYLKSTGVAKLIRIAELANPFAAGSIQDRVNTNWTPTLDLIETHPLGVGIGYGSYTIASGSVASTGLWMGPHNELLQKALETGLPGAMLFLLLLISMIQDARTANGSGGILRLFGSGMLATSVAFWICAIVNLPFCGAPGLAYWTFAGAMIGVLSRRQFPAKLPSRLHEST